MSICSFFDTSVNAGSSNGITQGIFIPFSVLAGLESSELATLDEQTKEGKVIYGLLNSLYTALATPPPLGITSVAKSNPSGTATNRSTEAIGLTFQWVQDLSTNSFYPPPLPSIGINAGLGGMALETIFPGCQKTTNEGAIPGAGIVISAADIAIYGGAHPSSVSSDARDWIAGLFGLLVTNAALRTTSTASAITAKTNPLTTRVTGLQIPSVWYDATAPISGLLATDIPHLRIIQDAFTITYEYENDPLAQTFEVRVATV